MSTKTKTTESSKKNATKNISYKNYIYAVLLLIGGILIALYICKGMVARKEAKLKESYLISSNSINASINDINSLSQIIADSPSAYFIYFGYTGSEDIYNLEKDLKKVIDNYGLTDIFYYVDLTNAKKDNDDYIKKINEILKINSLENVPAIVYVHENTITNDDVLDGVNNTMLKVQDLEKLLDIYEFESIK